ncbi:MAG TPA: M56 family metallopeptidase [Xanthomonadales bacterium]|nr:M56 family metallopeptidase [Xanthomonadales bacterium]
MAESLLELVATYLLHSTLLLGAAWLADASGAVRAIEAREFVWRLAFFGAFATTLATVVSLPAPAVRQDAAPVAAVARPVGVATHDATTRPASTAPSRGSAASVATVADRVGPSQRAVLAAPSPSARVIAAAAVFAALLALAGLVRLALAVLRERRAARRLAPCTDASLLREATELAARLHAPVPVLSFGAHDAGPYAAGASRICVPRWSLALGREARRGMIAHELAHLARRDPYWRIAAAACARLGWMQPLNLLATRRIDDLAELACDARAARALGDGRALAGCLADCAERMFAPAPRWSAARSRRRSALVERIETLLEEQTVNRPHRTVLVRIAGGAALLVCLAALPAVQFAVQAAERGDSVHIRSSLLGAESFRMKSDRTGLDARIEGKVRFSEAEDDIVALDDQAYIEQRVDGVTRRIEFENARGGVERRYSVDGKEQPIDAAGRAWLADVIPMLLRESGFDAEARVARIKARGGAAAVLDETDRISGDFARRTYLATLAASGPMAPDDLDRAIAIASRSGSDFEARSSYVALIEHQALGGPQQAAVLDGVAKIGSDFEQRTVLEALAPKLVLEGAVPAAWSGALATIESDFEARSALTALAERDDLPAGTVRFALANTAGIGSDFEHRTALEALVRHVRRDPALVKDYAASAAGIGSDFECRSALLALVEHAELDAESARAVLEAAAGIGSDFEQRSVLVELAQRMPADESLIRRYRQVARGLGDFERGQAEKALDRFELL